MVVPAQYCGSLLRRELARLTRENRRRLEWLQGENRRLALLLELRAAAIKPKL